MTDSDDGGRPRRGPRRHLAWHGLRVLWVLALAPLVFAGIAAAMMIDRDITAPSWITRTIEARAGQLLGGGTLDFGAIHLRIGSDLHPRVRLSDTVLRDAEGVTLARIAEVSGLISPRGLLFERTALMQEVQLSGAQVALRRKADGSVALSFDVAARETGAASLPELMRQIDTIFERPALVALEQVRLTDLVLNYSDARAGQSWTLDGGAVSLDLRSGATRLHGEAFVLSGGAVAGLTLDYDSPQGRLSARIAAELRDIRARDLAGQSAALSWLSALEAPISARLETTLDETGALGALDGRLDIGAGTLRPGGRAAPLHFDRAATRFSYDPARARIGFDDLSLASDWGDLKGEGQALLREMSGGLPGALLGQFRLHDLRLNPGGLYPGAAPLDRASVDLRLRLDPFAVEIGQLVLGSAEGQITGKGHARATPDGWDLALDLAAPEVSVAGVKALWPASVSPGARGWFDRNVHEGTLTDLDAGLRLRPGARPLVAAEYDFADARLTFMRSMPDLTDAGGTGQLIGDSFVVRLDAGQVLAGQGGAVEMAGSVLRVPDRQASPVRPELTLAARSTITAALSLMDRPPFAYASRAGLAVTLADGRAETTGRVVWPAVAGSERRPGDVDYGFAATLTRLRSDGLVPGRRLTSARMQLEVDPAGLRVEGPLTLDGIPMRARYDRPFDADAGGRSAVSATVELSPRFLEAFGIALPQGSVQGTGRGDLVLDFAPERAAAFTLASDLAGVRLAVPQLGWVKAASAPGSLQISGTLGNPAQIDRLRLSGAGLELEGAIRLAPGGGLEMARFERLRLGNWLDAPVTLRGRGAGAPPAVDLSGGRVDLRRAAFGGTSGDGGPLDVVLDRLQVTDGIALTGFRGSFTGTGGFSGRFEGRVNDGATVQGTIVPQGGRSAIRLQSADAGGAARAAGLLRNATGGTLDLTLLPTADEGTFDGALAVRGLRVRDAPAMAALLDAVSVVGLLQQLDGQGLAFDEVDARFRLTPRGVQIIEASAVGPGLGISLDGFYTLASKQLDLQGVISPFYLLNGIGSILTRKGEGLIGFAYAVRGTADAPEVSVNPLSAFTPGMFREIFRRPAPEVGE